MLRDKPAGWEKWKLDEDEDSNDLQQHASWFYGNGKSNGSGGVKGRFGIRYFF